MFRMEKCIFIAPKASRSGFLLFLGPSDRISSTSKIFQHPNESISWLSRSLTSCHSSIGMFSARRNRGRSKMDENGTGFGHLPIHESIGGRMGTRLVIIARYIKFP